MLSCMMCLVVSSTFCALALFLTCGSTYTTEMSVTQLVKLEQVTFA